MIIKFVFVMLLLFFLVGCAQKELLTEETPVEEDVAEKELVTGYSGKVLAGTVTPYLDFNKEDYDKAVSENKIILLYFYASWCPICRIEQPKTFAAFNEMGYDNVIGFRVNYRDSSVDEFEEKLAKDHGITYQHTKVIIKDGQRVLKAPDTWNKERYLEEIGKVV